MQKKVIYYIDGLNFYHGLKQSNLRRYYWLNYLELATKLLNFDENLEIVKYFTTVVKRFFDPPKHDRQINYISALTTLDKNRFKIIYGKHQEGYRTCRNCNYTMPDFKEKRTDVNIASEIFKDAYNKNCDVIKLISADSDYIPICRTIIELFPKIEIEVLFSPGRKSDELAKICHRHTDIFTTIIVQSQFVDPVENISKNTNYYKPLYWS